MQPLQPGLLIFCMRKLRRSLLFPCFTLFPDFPVRQSIIGHIFQCFLPIEKGKPNLKDTLIYYKELNFVFAKHAAKFWPFFKILLQQIAFSKEFLWCLSN